MTLSNEEKTAIAEQFVASIKAAEKAMEAEAYRQELTKEMAKKVASIDQIDAFLVEEKAKLAPNEQK
jgi:hypothetical protein